MGSNTRVKDSTDTMLEEIICAILAKEEVGKRTQSFLKELSVILGLSKFYCLEVQVVFLETLCVHFESFKGDNERGNQTGGYRESWVSTS